MSGQMYGRESSTPEPVIHRQQQHRWRQNGRTLAMTPNVPVRQRTHTRAHAARTFAYKYTTFNWHAARAYARGLLSVHSPN